MLTTEEPALAVPGKAVRLTAGLAKRGDSAAGAPSAKMVARHVAEQQIAVCGVPQRTLGEEKARRPSRWRRILPTTDAKR
jgi:hypothetical protein